VIVLPDYPAPLPAGATPEQRLAYEDARARYNDMARAMHAEAQAATAAAMQANVTATNALAAALSEKSPSRAELIWDLTKVQPQASILTPSQIVSGASQIVDAYIKANPAAVSP
jgi:hypothetical protein